MRNYFLDLKYVIKNYSRNKYFVIEFILTILFLIISLTLFSRFLVFVEARDGVVLNDVLLNQFEAIDLSYFIFFTIYGSILFTLSKVVLQPYRLLLLFQSYSMMIILRMLFMLLLPLSPPIGAIILKDPLVDIFGSVVFTKDLFFSGHTATMFILYKVLPKEYKSYFLLITLILMASLLLQKTHYSIDVLVAPFISIFCVSFCKSILKNQSKLD